MFSELEIGILRTPNSKLYILCTEFGTWGGIIQGVLTRWEGAMRDGGLD
jgi:hypothetical protein